MPGSIKEQRTMNYLTMNNKYVPDISVYSRPFAVKSFIWLNLVFFSVNLCQSAISADKKMQNEPNPVLSEVEWISQVAHLINEQRTMNICQTNPISAQINVNSVMTKYYINEQRTMNNKQFPNEPNLNPFSPATTWRGCLAPTPAMDVFYLTVEWAKVDYAQRTSSIKYPESRIEQKMSNEPNLQGGQFAHLINEQRTMPALSSVEGNNEQFTNEPNFTCNLQMHPLNSIIFYFVATPLLPDNLRYFLQISQWG